VGQGTAETESEAERGGGPACGRALRMPPKGNGPKVQAADGVRGARSGSGRGGNAGRAAHVAHPGRARQRRAAVARGLARRPATERRGQKLRTKRYR